MFQSSIINYTNNLNGESQHNNGTSKFYKFFNELFKTKNPEKTRVMIKSWTFKDFDVNQKFQVRKLYSIKPISLTYNSTREEYKYSKQIISEFCIKEANGNIKKLLIIDNLKNGKVKREKYIDGKSITGQHYNFEIRSHRLNRGLMKTFLFHQINKNNKLGYDQNRHIRYHHADMNDSSVQPMTNVACQVKDSEVPIRRTTGRFSVEYIKKPVLKVKVSAPNRKNILDLNTYYALKNRVMDTADDSIVFNHA